MNIKLSDHFTYKKLLRFTLPSIAMMIFSSIYGVVDGFFVSNYVGKTPFAAVNFIMPFLMILGCIGFMFGTGGSALVAKTMGEGDTKLANRQFSLIVYASIATSVIIGALGVIFLRPIAAAMGAEGQMLEDCVTYGRIILFALPAYVLQMEFQSFVIAAERPNLGLAVTLAAGCTNMVLDFLLVGVFPLGLVGAATATAISQAVGGIIPLIYFACPNKSLLRLTGTRFSGRVLVKTCVNGSSELMSNIAMSTVSILYNAKLLEYEGENGVAAYGVLMYVGFIFFAAFIGYIIGTAPVISYNYGASNHEELKGIFKRSLVIVGMFSVSMVVFAEVLAYPLSMIFVGYDAELLELSCRAFVIYSFSFLFAGYAIFGSGFFTALNDGLTSAIISFLRTLVFQIAAVIILPLLMGTDGIWLSLVVAEMMAVAVAAVFVFVHRKKYKYL
ncbi:MAG: MATE family efflux transporter [Clostridia bacterium]|nr:MATE family efflux transporter [Clostridia bacterium]